jgi:hypothetical protein
VDVYPYKKRRTQKWPTMQRNFYTDDFEQLIRQKADQYKMYPSDHVWKGVHRALHTRRRWYWAGMAILLLGAGIYTANYFVNTHAVNAVAKKLQSSLSATQQVYGTIQHSQADADANSTQGSNARPERISAEPVQIATSQFRASGLLPAQQSSVNNFVSPGDMPLLQQRLDIAQLPLKSNADRLIAPFAISPEYADAASESVQTSAQLNWLQEYAVYQLTVSKQQRIGWMLYFSPTVNYRKLTGSSTELSPVSEIQSVPLALSFNGAVDQYVHHKPALGFELGNSFLYRTSKHINFKAGLQFNYSRYNIEAYSTHPEKATIALNPYWNADTIVTYTSVRNMSGYAQQEIANQYFELSMPVGVELRLFGTEKLQLDVAGTVQPTYLLNRNSYLITTDYKNYTREPSLVRRWNVNAGIETYVAYNTGTVRWQLGPQFRYQLLSTYQNKYPIKEYLMEYGFKIGVSKTIR